MTAIGGWTAQRAHAARGPFALRPAVLALARIEGRHIVRHPLFLAGIAASAALSVSFAEAVEFGGAYLVLLGPTLLPVAMATLVVCNLAALRWRRGDTGELYGSVPAPPHARTLAHLLALAWPAAAVAALVAAGFVGYGAWDGLPITPAGDTATPRATDLAQGPVAVAAFGALGIALARWIPYPPVAIVGAAFLFPPQMMLTMWNLQDGGGWLLPFVNPARTARMDASWPCAADQQWPCVLDSLAPLHWHLAYLGALIMLFAALALLRDGRRRADLLLGASGLIVAVAAGLLQLP